MILYKKAKDLTRYIRREKSKGTVIGFVPTMGALHQGHLSLIDRARGNQGLCICSIFVNPTQFNDHADFLKYPRSIENDIYLLEKKGTDILFMPSAEEIYPNGTAGLELYDLGYLETVWEGQYRPGHFQGVCQVMRRLLEIVQPDHVFMGQKDIQQCLIVKKLLGIIGSGAKICRCPTQREPDGLAMSSRNVRLNADQRKRAAAIYQALRYLKENIRPGDLSTLKSEAKSLLDKNKFQVDYLAIAEVDSLEPLDLWDGRCGLIALAAAFQDEVRLIDNLELNTTADQP